jgi:hypothetical protein
MRLVDRTAPGVMGASKGRRLLCVGVDMAAFLSKLLDFLLRMGLIRPAAVTALRLRGNGHVGCMSTAPAASPSRAELRRLRGDRNVCKDGNCIR